MSQTRLCGLCILTAFNLTPGNAYADQKADAVIAKAIEAHGGEKLLKQTTNGWINYRVTPNIDPLTGIPFTIEEVYSLPGRSRRITKAKFNGNDFYVAYGIRDRKAWVKKGSAEPEIVEVQEPPSVRKTPFAMLALLADIQGEGWDRELIVQREGKEQATVGIRVSFKETQEAAEMYFDKTTGLYERVKKRQASPFTGQETDMIVVFKNYKDIGGVKYPMQWTSLDKGKVLFEIAILDIKFPRSIEDDTFNKP